MMNDADIPFRMECGILHFDRRSAKEMENNIYRIRVVEKKDTGHPS